MSGHPYESSEEEEESGVQVSELVQSVLRSYSGGGDNAKELKKTQHLLENLFQSDSATCLICIARVRNTQPIWSCQHCYCFLHLACIQRWANDSIAQKKLHHDTEAAGYYTNQGDYIAKKALSLTWHCPQCRHDYQKTEIPTRYSCFCGKVDDPKADPWTLPHSCGEVCGKALMPNCGHKCLLLCHPGACPPCPQMISRSCDCAQSPLKTIRCSLQSWQCGKPCDKTLSCGNHKCTAVCHKSCKPCTKKSLKCCLCGKRKSEKNCSEGGWTCDEPCTGKFDCGKHECNRGCHQGPCGPCALPKSCPCGKKISATGDCSSQVDSCGDTCQKLLDCGQHKCLDRCHKGVCSTCKEIVEKSCSCGSQTREISCSKPFRCETKCKKLRDCKLHLCNRKCCDGQCPPCDKVCDKPLACTKHKCKSMCHTGPCYPCNLKAHLKCRCTGTVIEVPCGRARKTKPPKCHLPCKRPSACHHENPHSCHDGDCPACVKVCHLPNDTTNCGHLCLARCHDNVLTRTVDKKWKPAGPWDVRPETIQFLKLPHPKCEQKVEIPCLGGHETVEWPCWDATPRTCGRPCGRRLQCGNHLCTRMCHPLVDILEECMKCEAQCTIQRPAGCDHPCKKACHPPPCVPCTAIIKTKCHCGLVQKMFRCNEAVKESATAEKNERRKKELMCCGNRCIKLYPCGHRCMETCHEGVCPNAEHCKKKVKVVCGCKMRKAEVSCEKLRQGNFTLPCDDSCQVKALERQQEEELMKREQNAVEEERKRLEMEEFERKYGTKAPKKRKTRENVVEDGTNWRKIAITLGLVLIPVVGTLVYFVVMD